MLPNSGEEGMKILLADDHALFRDGMRYVLRELGAQVEILDAGNFPDALSAARDNPGLDLALLDLDMPGSEGAFSVGEFCACYPDIPVVVISGTEQREDIERVIAGGAMGFVSKASSMREMVYALHQVLDGNVCWPPQLLLNVEGQDRKSKRGLRANKAGLTMRQIEVLQHLAMGLSNRDIGQSIGMAEGTVKVHVAAIFQALRVNRRLAAVQAAQSIGLLADGNPVS